MLSCRFTTVFQKAGQRLRGELRAPIPDSILWNVEVAEHVAEEELRSVSMLNVWLHLGWYKQFHGQQCPVPNVIIMLE